MKLLSVLLCVAGLASSALAGGSGLVILDPGAQGALSLVGNTKVLIPARAVYVNSTHIESVTTSGHATLDVPHLYLCGGASFTGASSVTGQVIFSHTPYMDPKAGMSFPDPSSMPNHGSKSLSGKANVVLIPGYYSGISVGGQSQLTLQPGVYVIGGSGFSANGGSISGDGVTIIMHQGALNISGSSYFNLTAPTEGPFSGVVIAQPPSNTAAMTLSGGGNFNLRGTVYAPKSLLSMVGTSMVQGQGPQMGDLVIANKVELKGNATIRIGDGSQQAVALMKSPLWD